MNQIKTSTETLSYSKNLISKSFRMEKKIFQLLYQLI